MQAEVKGIIFSDFVNYKKISLTIEMPKCDFKCDRECGSQVCQNSSLALEPSFSVDVEDIVAKYCNDPLAEAIVFQGLEPFDSYEELILWIDLFRCFVTDDIVIYTGYNKDEIEDKLTEIKKYGNIIIKYGRFIPNQESHFDEVLGVNLASPNQYAEVLA